MNRLKLYRIKIDYIRYLYEADKKVQYNPNEKYEYTEKRPYLGIVLKINNYNYFVPLEHPRVSHIKMKNNIFLLKIHNGKYGILGFNNMIPVPQNQLIKFDINLENEKYKHILISQYRFCNKNVKEIEKRARETYFKRIQGKNKFLINTCCNFQVLEDKCKIYSNL